MCRGEMAVENALSELSEGGGCAGKGGEGMLGEEAGDGLEEFEGEGGERHGRERKRTGNINNRDR